MRLRFGVMFALSLGNSLAERWTSYLEAILANRFPQQASAKAKVTSDTSGLPLQREFQFFSRECVSLKTLKDTSAWECHQLSATWSNSVMKSRGEYLARLKLARATNGGEYSSLPTPCANEDSFRLKGSSQQSKTLEARARRGELKTAGFANDVERMSLMAANATMENINVLRAPNGPIRSCTNHRTDARNVENRFQAGQTIQAGPLNPAFVEVMMGVPIGWTDYECSGTE
jgi:hypothetical protein